MMTWRLTMTGVPLRSRNFSSPKGTGPWPISAARPSALSSTRRISSVAVRPRMSLALATSCTPGSSTTTRSAPCCWITGSATPSSLTRLCSVVMFCLMALSCTRRSASGLKPITSRPLSLAWLGAISRSGNLSCTTRRTASSEAASCARTSMFWPSRVMPPWRTFLSRRATRRSLTWVSRFLVSAVRMSTCSKKWTPPRKSSPRYMGLAFMANSHEGVRETRFSATM